MPRTYTPPTSHPYTSNALDAPPVVTGPIVLAVAPDGESDACIVAASDVATRVGAALEALRAIEHLATYAIGTPGHSWQLTAQGKTPAAHKGLVHVAKVMAGTAVDVIQDPPLLARAKADHKARTDATPYVCPLPPDVHPPVAMSGGGGAD